MGLQLPQRKERSRIFLLGRPQGTQGKGLIKVVSGEKVAPVVCTSVDREGTGQVNSVDFLR